jgi:hypothetical protein
MGGYYYVCGGNQTSHPGLTSNRTPKKPKKDPSGKGLGKVKKQSFLGDLGKGPLASEKSGLFGFTNRPLGKGLWQVQK